MQYPVGSATETSHAAGLIALYPAWIKHEFGVNNDRINDVLSWLGLESAKTDEEAKDIFCAFTDELGISCTLSDLGVCADDVESLVENVTGNLKSDRLSEIPDILTILYSESL